MIKRSLVRKLPSCGRLSWPAFSPSWQPHHHDVNHISIRSRVNSGLKTFSGAKPCVFSGEVASVVAEGSLFPWVRGSIGESCRRKAHRTEARARFALKHVKQLRRSEHFWKMRSTKCARDSSERLISHKKLRSTFGR